MRWLRRPRTWIALLLGVATALIAHEWPASPRAVLQCDHTCWDLAFSADGGMLAALEHEPGLNQEAHVHIWDATTGERLHRFAHGKQVYSRRVVFAPDGKTLAILDVGAVTLWDLEKGKAVATYTHPSWSRDPDHQRELLVSPEGRWLLHEASAGRVYDVVKGRTILDYGLRWPERNARVHGGVVAARVQGEVKTFNVLSGNEIAAFANTATHVPFARLAMTLSGDGTHGMYFSNDGDWVIHNATLRREIKLQFDGDGINCWPAFSRDNRFVAVSMTVPKPGPIDLARMYLGQRRRTDIMHVYDTATGAKVGPPILDGQMSCFSPDGTTLAVTDRSQRIMVWDWPPTGRWPLMLTLAAITMLVSWGLCEWRVRRSPSPSAGQTP